ncbi:Mitochondrial import inner membrane translocase subunit tim23 [Sporothrix eucalyptigena]|uniref:Mitochondrial import inner membrane translocase subunit tim23 n=1 Tax=Sporothrix eucalyptigena TaxID=1812306 RepID=A0ABP0D4P9_9PEZI
MSIWGALTGRKSQSTSSPSSPSDHHGADHAASSSPAHNSTIYSSSSPADASSVGGGALATLGGSGTDSFLQSSAFADPTQLHPLAGLNKETLEYISMEDSALSDLPGSQSVLPSRGFTDDLCYGAGITYLTALTIGGAWGLQEGLRRSAGQPPKLRLNSVLNAVTRRGPFLGNSAGVVAIAYNCINSYIGYLRGRHDAANSVVAGALSGMLFKSTRGLRPMLISGGIVASIAAAWTVTRRTFFPIPEPNSPSH